LTRESENIISKIPLKKGHRQFSGARIKVMDRSTATWPFSHLARSNFKNKVMDRRPGTQCRQRLCNPRQSTACLQTCPPGHPPSLCRPFSARQQKENRGSRTHLFMADCAFIYGCARHLSDIFITHRTARRTCMMSQRREFTHEKSSKIYKCWEEPNACIPHNSRFSSFFQRWILAFVTCWGEHI
jgi:hypothetical protein